MSPTHSNRGGMKHRDDPQTGGNTPSDERGTNRMGADRSRSNARQRGHENAPGDAGRKGSPAQTDSNRHTDRRGTRPSAGDRDGPRDDDSHSWR